MWASIGIYGLIGRHGSIVFIQGEPFPWNTDSPDESGHSVPGITDVDADLP
jgi:hypothetical protein